ncbi:hypothetical protein EDB85DRAFT_1896103 [Lactarius pseudohatsudake]|nr:hypothetical protein EDB85DRAFT_1896103 [Lactarius pseudohatsudake]
MYQCGGGGAKCELSIGVCTCGRGWLVENADGLGGDSALLEEIVFDSWSRIVIACDWATIMGHLSITYNFCGNIAQVQQVMHLHGTLLWLQAVRNGHACPHMVQNFAKVATCLTSCYTSAGATQGGGSRMAAGTMGRCRPTPETAQAFPGVKKSLLQSWILEETLRDYVRGILYMFWRNNSKKLRDYEGVTECSELFGAVQGHSEHSEQL